LRERRAMVSDWLAQQDVFEWVEPRGGVVGFPRAKLDTNLNLDSFYRSLNLDLGTYVGPGHWFDQERRYFRLGFGWPTREALAAGLASLSEAARRARR
jgi:DNA-binding transcriptional MocR family regulator